MSRPLSNPGSSDDEFDRAWRGDNVSPLPPAPKLTIQQQFEAFHTANPEVYATLVRLARQYRDRVGTEPGMKMLWEVMRWTVAMETRDASVYKLNNNYTSRYSRLIARQEPDLADAFEQRTLRAA